jgi:hypothetical protein
MSRKLSFSTKFDFDLNSFKNQNFNRIFKMSYFFDLRDLNFELNFQIIFIQKSKKPKA